MKRIAACCCGQLSITVSGDPIEHGVCHCDNCKKRTGSAFGISAYFKEVQIQATIGDFNIYRISSKQERCFCPVCATTLFWRIASRNKQVGIAGGCFVDDYLTDPTMTLTSTKMYKWVTLPGEWDTA